LWVRQGAYHRVGKLRPYQQTLDNVDQTYAAVLFLHWHLIRALILEIVILISISEKDSTSKTQMLNFLIFNSKIIKNSRDGIEERGWLLILNLEIKAKRGF
jgi:hypothetical protein